MTEPTSQVKFNQISSLDAEAITSGSLSTDRFSAYADLTAEDRIGASASGLAIGDHFHASTSASTITSGTLSTDRFSAYGDLVVEDRIGASASGLAIGTHTHTESQITDLDHTDTNAIHGNVSGEIDALTAITIPVLDDKLIQESSANSYAKREMTLGTLSLLKDDRALKDTTNGDHFTQYSAATPTGWTAVTAATGSVTSALYSFWQLTGSGVLTWKYNKQSGITIESVVANEWRAFQWGPMYIRDGLWASDIEYVFGAYADNAGAPNADVYTRTHLKWDALSYLWWVWGESKNGTTVTTSTAVALPNPPSMPFYLRQVIRNDTNRTVRAYYGTGYTDMTHTVLQSTTLGPITVGNVWLQVDSTRSTGTGVNDVIYIGSVDTYASSG